MVLIDQSDHDFPIKPCDRMSQLILEKIRKTVVEEVKGIGRTLPEEQLDLGVQGCNLVMTRDKRLQERSGK